MEGVEQLVEAARDAGRYRDAVDVVGVFGVLPTDVHLTGRRASGAGNGLLEDL